MLLLLCHQVFGIVYFAKVFSCRSQRVPLSLNGLTATPKLLFWAEVFWIDYSLNIEIDGFQGSSKEFCQEEWGGGGRFYM